MTASEPEVTRRFRDVAERVLDAVLQASPEWATSLGDHRFDDQVSDLSPDGVAATCAVLTDALSALDDIDDAGLEPADQVDLEILRTRLSRDQWQLSELRLHESDPMAHLPSDGIYPLLARETGDPASRLRALAARLAAVPRGLAVAREVLHDMPRVHVETAILQTRGTIGMLGADLDELLAREPALAGEVEPARQAAAEALTDYARWLEDRLPDSHGDPRLGAERYAARLWYELDTEIGPDTLLTRAESDLQAIEERIAELAGQLSGGPAGPGQVRPVLDRLAASAPVTDATILDLCRESLAHLDERVAELDLVTIPDAPVEIIEMPESRRGVAVAYCDAPGPLEPRGADGRPAPTFFAVSPTPAGWPQERVESFYREYNRHMLWDLAVHEAMPGHVLQLAHAAQYTGSTRVRAACWSSPFAEGWAVYAEELVAGAGLGLGPEADAALRMQMLKMQLRSTINAILDVRVHARGMTQDEAMRLMRERGHQEEGEATGKWRRALLTSAQLSTYYVGFQELREIARRLRERHGAERALHDAMLAHGTPPPRHLRTLLGL